MAKTPIEVLYHTLVAKEFATHAARAKHSEIVFANNPGLVGGGKTSDELLAIALEHERLAAPEIEPSPDASTEAQS